MAWNAWFPTGYDLISEVKTHRPSSSPFQKDVCMCWTRLQRRLQTCYIKCPAVWIRCTFLWGINLDCSPLEEEFRSLLCAPLKDGTVPVNRHHSQTWRCCDGICSALTNLLFPHRSRPQWRFRWHLCRSRLQYFKHQFFLGKGTFNNNISRLFQDFSPPSDPNYTAYAAGTKRMFPLILHSGTIVFHWKLWFPTITLLSSNERPSCQPRIL